MLKPSNLGISIEHQSQEKLEKYVSVYESSVIFHFPSTSPCTGSPYKVTLQPRTYFIDCFSGRGGGEQAGKGGSASGFLKLNEEKTFYFFVGAQGSSVKCMTYGGGGMGGRGTTFSGGGSTDIRLINSTDDEGLRSRIIVAAGGGGFESYSKVVKSGDGGGINGEDGQEGYASEYQAARVKGATQTSG